MKAMIFEPVPFGHRLTGVRVLAEALLEIIDDVLIVTSDGAPSGDPYKNQILPIENRVKVMTAPFPSEGTPWTIGRKKLSLLHHVLKNTKVDHVYIPYADGMTQIAGLLAKPGLFSLPKGTVAEALTMRGTYAYPGADKFKARLMLRALEWSPWNKIHLIDPLAYRFVHKNLPRLAKRCPLLADPIETRPGIDRKLARRLLGLPEDGRYLGCIGEIDSRKGGELLLRAFKRAKLEETDRLYLAGRLTQPVRDVLNNELGEEFRAGRIITPDRYLTEDELNWATSALDVVVTPYPGFVGSASIVIRAAAAGRVVLGNDYGWMGYVIPTFKLGRVCDATNVDVLADAFPQKLDKAMTYVPDPISMELSRFYSIDNVRAGWTAGIRQRLGLPPRAGTVEWPDPNLLKS